MILASKSPRRKEILEDFGFDIVIKSEEVEEVSDREKTEEKIKDIAFKKTAAVAVKHPSAYVVGADTVVVLEGKILGKPGDEREAFEMLKRLSGREHQVITAYSFMNINKGIEITEFDTTKVWFKKMSDEEIGWYIATREPMDKAGAYGIQGKGAAFVEKIEGDFFNVMGFPLSKFIDKLKQYNIEIKDMTKL